MATTTLSSRTTYRLLLLLALIAMGPGLVNFTAFGSLRQTIATDLGVSAADVTWVTLLGNAALAFGFLVAADVACRVSVRRLILTALGLSAVSSLGAALAPNLPLLIVSHAVQGFAAGLISSSMVLVLLSVAGPRARLPITLTVLGIGLFGASTLGPLLGGVAEHWTAWRELLIGNGLLALVAILLTWAVVREQPAPRQPLAFGVPTLVLAAIGLGLLFLGIGELSWHHWTRAEVEVPGVLGLVILLALTSGQWARCGLVRRLGLVAAAVVCGVAAFGFGALLDVMLEFLQDVRGLGAQDAGLLLWPAPVAACVGLVVAGLIFSRPAWTVAAAVCGALLLVLPAWLLTSVTAYTGDQSVMQLAALLGLGAGISIAPVMLLTVFSVPKELVGRSLALIAWLPYVFMAASGPLLTYVSTVRQTIHYGNLLWEQGFQVFVGASAKQEASATASTSQLVLNHALVLGVNDAAAVLVLLLLLGTAIGLVLLTPALARRGPAARRVGRR